MDFDTKLNLIETFLQKEQGTLSTEDQLEQMDCWDSLTMLNVQMELIMYSETVTLEDIRNCKTVGDLFKFLS